MVLCRCRPPGACALVPVTSAGAPCVPGAGWCAGGSSSTTPAQTLQPLLAAAAEALAF